VDHLLFNASIKITLGDGAKNRFWHHNWLDGEAPNLFWLVSRKNRSVQHELWNNNWMSSLREKITSAIHIEEFVSLWIRIQDVHLQQGVRDSITWRWTPDGVYSTRSAYRIQFKGSFRYFHTNIIWKAQVENKCKIFTWILVQDKILTAQNLQKRGWPHQDHCVLCNGPLETYTFVCAAHLQRWSGTKSSLGRTSLCCSQPQGDPVEIRAWWEEAAKKSANH
jgi:hypothetical protein